MSIIDFKKAKNKKFLDDVNNTLNYYLQSPNLLPAIKGGLCITNPVLNIHENALDEVSSLVFNNINKLEFVNNCHITVHDLEDMKNWKIYSVPTVFDGTEYNCNVVVADDKNSEKFLISFYLDDVPFHFYLDREVIKL